MWGQFCEATTVGCGTKITIALSVPKSMVCNAHKCQLAFLTLHRMNKPREKEKTP